MKKYLALLIAFMMVFALPVAANDAPEEKEGLKKDLVILFTSDIHCGVDQNIGFVGLKAIRDYFDNSGAYTLLVDDGDSVQGEPLGTLTNGEAVIELMNDMGYDIATPGNHDFDYGMDQFFINVKKANFPFISCNFVKDGELVFPPYVIKEFDGVKIAFVGVTTPKTLITSTPVYFQDEKGNYVYGFNQDQTGEGVYDAVQKAVDDARAEGAEYVFLMAHLGNEDVSKPWTYADVLSNTNGIDALMDGHSHDTDQVVMKNKDGNDVIRSACGTKMAGVGCIRISANDGKISSNLIYWGNNIPATELFGIKNDITKKIEAAKATVEEKISKVVARSDVDLVIYDPNNMLEDGSKVRIVRRQETNLGDLCADAFRDQSGADVAFVNGGGIRVDILKGDITMGEILSVHPFGNEMCMIEVTGQQLLDALEWGARAVPDENGAFLQVSGLTYEINSEIESSCVEGENGMFVSVDGERRVQNVKVGGEDLDPEKTYTLASHNYMLLEHGDGFTMFDGNNLVLDRVKIDNQVLIDYITKTLGGVIGEEYADPYGQGRIVILEKAEENSDSAASNAAA